MAETAAYFMALSLEKAGVERVYGVVGDSLNGLTDALRKRGKIEWIHVRHEEAGAFAAGAEAQITGNLAVCVGSCGPGNLHLINGLFDCHRSGVPVLAIAAHIPSTELGIDYFQATHPEILFKECSHYAELVSHPEQLPQVLERAMRVAIARKGVAVVVIPGDVALKPLAVPVPNWIAPRSPVIRPSAEDVEDLANILNAAGDVTLLCGAGCAGAREEVLALAEKLKAPIVHALRGKEWIEYDNPFDVGMTGFIGFASGYAAMKACDTLVMLGTSFPYRQFYPDNAKVVQIDISPEALGNRHPLDLGILADIRETLRAALPSIDTKSDASHLNRAIAHYQTSRRKLDELAESDETSKIVHPQYLNRLVSELAAEDAIFTCDVGTPTVWAARYLALNGKRRLLGSFNHGSMANALPQAIGAQAAFPERQVVSLCGDGGFTMMMGDFITLSQVGLPVKVIVLNNGTLGFVEMEMKASGFLDTGCDLKNPNFAAMSEAMGIRGFRVEKPQDLRGALSEAFAHNGPALVDVVSARQELVMPPKASWGQAHDFGVFLLKAVLGGRTGEVIDLANVNLLR
ncbi:ubiquinone-dependent pyruvate dehydrogenase [Agrobacterium sp. B1(2019)]|uniref:ubiquinone-dependent pyruvate dehydrogenase n=1 Tax=Agrobacterium sp. B1(2019) TaxID=2607032 RepID=UPI0011F00A15|nr:ubiquinone-dependent pyruvate dehydrogenase [Agrobacterium sp. B1(2019)]TZG36031.1 ubiquinone-dependent pyruvate dehydrogenase [Agrobacterium sp. B1(2019)]